MHKNEFICEESQAVERKGEQVRDLNLVISNLIDVIPADEEELLHELIKIQISARYTAPELINMWWRRIHEILCDYVFNEDFDENSWRGKVRRIYVGEE